MLNLNEAYSGRAPWKTLATWGSKTQPDVKSKANGGFMQYCNDCFAKMGDDARHCDSCQSRDIRSFDSGVSADPRGGVISEKMPDSPSKPIKVNPIYLVEPKEKVSTRHEAPVMYFSPTPKEAKNQAKNDELNRKAAGKTSISPFRETRIRRKRLNRYLAFGLLVAAPIALASYQLAQDKAEINAISIWETLKADVYSLVPQSDSKVEPASSDSADTKVETAKTKPKPKPKPKPVFVRTSQETPVTETERAAITTLFYDNQQSIAKNPYTSEWILRRIDFVMEHNYPGMYDDAKGRSCFSTDNFFSPYNTEVNPDLYSIRRDTEWSIPKDLSGNLLSGTKPKANVFILNVYYPTTQRLEHVAIVKGKAYYFKWVCGG